MFNYSKNFFKYSLISNFKIKGDFLVNLRKKVYEYMDNHPLASSKRVQEALGLDSSSIPVYCSTWRRDHGLQVAKAKKIKEIEEATDPKKLANVATNLINKVHPDYSPDAPKRSNEVKPPSPKKEPSTRTSLPSPKTCPNAFDLKSTIEHHIKTDSKNGWHFLDFYEKHFMNSSHSVTNSNVSNSQSQRFISVTDWNTIVDYGQYHLPLFDWIIGGYGVLANGVRGTGKTTTIADALAYLLRNEKVDVVHCFAGKRSTASENLDYIRACLLNNDWSSDELGRKNNLKDNSFVCELPNGGRIEAHANTRSDINKARGVGTRKFAIWVDEANQQTREVWDDILGFLSGTINFIFIISGNPIEDNGNGFNTFCESPERADILNINNMSYFEFDRHTITWQDSEQKNKIDRLLQVLGTDGAKQKQLSLELVQNEGALYNLEDVRACFVDSFIDPELYHLPDLSNFKNKCIFIDWGEVHDTAILCLGTYKGRIYELFSWSRPFKNVKEEDLFDLLREMKEVLDPSGVFAEKSSIGLTYNKKVAEIFKDHNCFFSSIQFVGKYEKDKCAAAAERIVKRHLAVLQNLKLKQQMKRIEIKNLNKKDHQLKMGDDLHDTWLYGARYLIQFTTLGSENKGGIINAWHGDEK
jgi:hypothetical protein